MRRNSLLKLWLIVTTFIVCFGACAKPSAPYHAQRLTEYAFRAEFVEQNRLYGDYLVAESAWEGLENEITIVIASQEQCDMVFADLSPIDFDKQVLVLHGYVTPCHIEDNVVTNVTLQGGRLRIEIGTPSSASSMPNATVPMTKWDVICLDKESFTTVEVVYLGIVP